MSMNTIVINGKTIVTTEKTISCINGEFFAGGKELIDTPPVLEGSTIIINGDVDTINLKSANLEVNGNVNGDICSTAGNIVITGEMVNGDIKVTGGNVECNHVNGGINVVGGNWVRK